MLTALKLGNFKAFADTQTIPLRPLTLIFGANSSGKSSIIHGLLWAHEASRTGNADIHLTQIGGDSVDLGGFRQFLHRHDQDREVEWAAEIDPDRLQEKIVGLDGQTLRIATSIGIKRSEGFFGRESEPTITSFDVHVGQTPVLRAEFAWDLTFHTRGIVGLAIKEFNENHPLIQRAIERGSRAFDGFPPRTRRRRKPNLTAYLRDVRLPGVGLTPPPSKSISSTMHVGSIRITLSSRRAGSKQALQPALFAINEILSIVHSVLTSELSVLSYLGPIRSYPSRHLALDSSIDANWSAGGGSAYALIARDTVVRDKVNAWLEHQLTTPYRLMVEHLWTERGLKEYILPGSFLDTIPVNLAVGVKEALENIVAKSPRVSREDLIYAAFEQVDERSRDVIQEHLQALGDYKDARLQDVWWRSRVLSLVDKRTETIVSHRDVGIGISQVLPVLASAHASRGQIVAIEQPEIHLHPKLQADLADVFIDSALGERKNMFILETHSEHLILRVMRRMRDTVRGQRKDKPPVRPEDVAVLFVEPTAEGSIVHELRLKPDGSLLDPWPGGFFEESFSEIFG